VTKVHKDGKIGMNGLDTSGGSGSLEYFGDGMKRMSRPKHYVRANLSRRHAKKIGVLLVFVTAIVIASALAYSPSASESPAKTIARAPPPPNNVFGLTTDEFGGMLFDCAITILNVNSGAVNYTTSYNYEGSGYAYYEFNLNDMDGGWTDGDIIRVTATNVTLGLEGQREGAITLLAGFLSLDITLYPVVIPEFPMVMVPVLGMVALVVVVSISRGRKEQ
jgi:hypothetical protein